MADIPPNVLRLMWEYDPEDVLQASSVPDVVIERVMARGGWPEMEWLLRTVGRERLRSILADRGSRVLPPRELSFWAVACDVPEETASIWRRDARRQESRWRG